MIVRDFIKRSFVNNIWWVCFILFPLPLLGVEDFWQDSLWIRKLPSGSNTCSEVKFHPNGKSVFVAADHYLFHYNVHTGELLKTFEMMGKGYVRDFEFSKNGKELVLITDIKGNGNTPCFELWNIDTGYVRHHIYENLTVNGVITSVAIGKNDSLLYVSGITNMVFLHILNYKTGDYIETKKDIGGYMDISPDRRYMVISYVENTGISICKLIDVEQWKILEHIPYIFTSKFSPDGRFIAGRKGISEIHLYDIKKKKSFVIKGNKYETNEFCFTNDGYYLVSTGQNQGYIVWDIETQKAVYEGAYYAGGTGYTALSPDNNLFANIGKRGGYYLQLWKFMGGVNSVLYKEHNDTPISVIPNPCSNAVKIQYPYIQKDASLILIDLNGKEMYRKNITESDKVNGSITIPISGFPSGTYVCSIIVNNFQVLSSTFTVN